MMIHATKGYSWLLIIENDAIYKAVFDQEVVLCHIMRKPFFFAKCEQQIMQLFFGQTGQSKVKAKCYQSLYYLSRIVRNQRSGFRPGPTQTRLYSYKRWLEA